MIMIATITKTATMEPLPKKRKRARRSMFTQPSSMSPCSAHHPGQRLFSGMIL